MVNKHFDRFFILPQGAVMTEGGGLDIQDNVLALVDIKKVTKRGAKVVGSLAGYRKDYKGLEFRQGTSKKLGGRNISDKAYASQPFSINEVVGVYASFPQRSEIAVDDVIWGYNGIDPNTKFPFHKGDRVPLILQLGGGALDQLNLPHGKVVIEDFLFADECQWMPEILHCVDCDPCEEVNIIPGLLRLIDRIKRYRLPGGAQVEEFVEVLPIIPDKPEPNPAPTVMNFFCITICDTGDDNALNLVQQQVPTLKVARIERNGSMSTYKVMKEGAAPAAFNQTLASIIKGCDDCPDGYNAVTGGYFYSVTLEDDGEDLTAKIEALPGLVAGTAQKIEGQFHGVGLYAAVLSAKLTDEQLDTFVEANPTAEIQFGAKIPDYCSNPAITTINWTACGSCEVTTQKWYITAPDDECGQSILPKLQEAYPDLVIEAYDSVMPPAACQHAFVTTVPTNMVCDQCDDIFKDLFRSEAPEPYGERFWTLVAPETTQVSHMVGIRFIGKKKKISPSACLINDIRYEEDSVRIAVSGGTPGEIREGINIYNHPINVEYLSRYQPVTHKGGEILNLERASRAFFSGFEMHGTLLEQTFAGETYRIDPNAQYAYLGVEMEQQKGQV